MFGLILSHRWSHLIPLYVMWLVCLNLVSEALIAQDYQRNQPLESAFEFPASTASGATGSGASPVAPPSPLATAPALPPEAANPSQPSDFALAPGQSAPAPNPALFPTPEAGSAQPTLAPTPATAITTPQPPTPAALATATPEATPFGAPISPSTPTPTTSPSEGINSGQASPARVAITLQTSVPRPGIGQLFEVAVTVEAQADRPVDTVQVYLDFDSSILRVVEVDAGARLEVVLQSGFDNPAGQVDYAAGTLGDSAQVPFTLVRLTFQVINPSGPAGTQLQFSPLVVPRETKAIEAGANHLGNLSPLILVIQ